MTLPPEIEKAIDAAWRKRKQLSGSSEVVMAEEWANDIARLVAEDCAAYLTACAVASSRMNPPGIAEGWRRAAQSICKCYSLGEPPGPELGFAEQLRRDADAAGCKGPIFATEVPDEPTDEPCDVWRSCDRHQRHDRGPQALPQVRREGAAMNITGTASGPDLKATLAEMVRIFESLPPVIEFLVMHRDDYAALMAEHGIMGPLPKHPVGIRLHVGPFKYKNLIYNPPKGTMYGYPPEAKPSKESAE